MSILATIVGCLLGVIAYKLLSLVTPVATWGEWSTGILVALCLLGVAFVGGYVFPLFSKPAVP